MKQRAMEPVLSLQAHAELPFRIMVYCFQTKDIPVPGYLQTAIEPREIQR